METILLVDSVNDDLTRRRHRTLEESSLLREFQLKYCYAAELSVEDQRRIEFGMLPDVKVEAQLLFQRIEDAIKENRPAFVILHSGFVFVRNMEVFFQVFAKLRQTHAHVDFGIQERPGIDVPPNLFSQTGRMRELHDLIFQSVLGWETGGVRRRHGPG